MPVTIVIDHWSPDKKRFREETFCYGPKACPLFKSGPPRRVPGRNRQVWIEEDWVDEEETAHRGPHD